MLLQFIANGLVLGSIYALASLGFAIVYNTTRIFHIAYAAFYMLCPYIMLSLLHGMGFGLLISFALAIVFTMALSVLVEYIVYRPLSKKESSLNIIMVSSIGVMIIVINTVAIFYGNETQILNSEISQSLSFWNVILTYTQIAQLFISLFLCGTFLLVLKFSKFGITTRAMRDDDILCGVMGMDFFSMRLALFALSGFFAAVAGGLVAYDVGMDPYVGMSMLLSSVVALIIGGIGRFEAPILGGFIIGILQSLTVWSYSSRWQDAITFILLIGFLLFRPNGILGERRRSV